MIPRSILGTHRSRHGGRPQGAFVLWTGALPGFEAGREMLKRSPASNHILAGVVNTLHHDPSAASWAALMRCCLTSGDTIPLPGVWQ